MEGDLIGVAGVVTEEERDGGALGRSESDKDIMLERDEIARLREEGLGFGEWRRGDEG